MPRVDPRKDPKNEAMDEGAQERALLEEWRAAESLARGGDLSSMIELLRRLYRPYEVPDTWFLADLLEGKFEKAKGRPPKRPIRAGLDQLLAAETVAYIRRTEKTTLEAAIAKAATYLPMSESTIKQQYQKCSKSGQLKGPLFFQERIELLLHVHTKK